jgi:hypothetical protein
MREELPMYGFDDENTKIQSFRQIAYGHSMSDLKKCDEHFIYELLDSVSNLKWMLNPNLNLFIEQRN